MDSQYAEIATEAWIYARDHLIRDENWNICSKYLRDPQCECKTLLDKFFSMMSMHLKKPEVFESDENIVRWLIEDSHRVLRTLKHSGRKTEEANVQERVAPTLNGLLGGV